MALAFGPTSCSSGLVPKSELLHSPAAQYGFVPKHSHHGGKYPALRAEKPFSARLRLSEIITMLASVMPSGSRFERSSMRSFFSDAVFLFPSFFHQPSHILMCHPCHPWNPLFRQTLHRCYPCHPWNPLFHSYHLSPCHL